MERVFANLYRMGAGNKRGVSYTYLLVRKEGNILVCHQTRPSDADMEEIDGLGGIGSQWVCHNHDVVRNGFHEAAYERFGCSLHHHKGERQAVRKKTKCPLETFGDEGLIFDTDFDALFFPACTAGHSLYRWKYRGKYYLFTSHAMYLNEGDWRIQCRPQPEAARIDKLQIDYVFPGYSPPQEQGFYRLDDRTRKALSEKIRINVQAA
jgi:hypothetical protein